MPSSVESNALVITRVLIGPWDPWGKAHAWPLGRATVLVGPSGSGKTRLLRALLVLRQSVEQPDAPPGGLQWQGRWVEDVDGRWLVPPDMDPPGLNIGIEVANPQKILWLRDNPLTNPDTWGWQWQLARTETGWAWDDHVLWVDGAPLARWEGARSPRLVAHEAPTAPSAGVVQEAAVAVDHPDWAAWRPPAEPNGGRTWLRLPHPPLRLAGPYTRRPSAPATADSPGSQPAEPAPPGDHPDVSALAVAAVEAVGRILRERVVWVPPLGPAWPPVAGWTLDEPDPAWVRRVAQANALLAAAEIPARLEPRSLTGTPPDLLQAWMLADPASGRVRTPLQASGSVRRLVELAWALSGHQPQVVLMEQPEVGVAPDMRECLYALLAAGAQSPHSHQYLIESHAPTELTDGLRRHGLDDVRSLDVTDTTE
jgi:energy-coupling factor transporter ATP-binding protein EcfA2